MLKKDKKVLKVKNGTFQIGDEKPEPGLESFQLEFLNDRRSQLKELSVQDSGTLNFESVKKAAHDWKGYSKAYGFDHLEKLALQIDQAVDSQDQSTCSDLLAEAVLYLDEKAKLL